MKPPFATTLGRLFGAIVSVAVFCPTIASAAAPSGTRYLFLVRHGDYDTIPLSESADGNGLNDLGREQAALVASRLAGLPVKFDTVVTSQLTRARETGDIVAAKLRAAVQRDANLNETRPPGDGVVASLVTPGAEAQLKQAWDRYARPAPTGTRNDLLICHGNVIRWFVCRALGADPKQWSRMDIANTSITIIEIRPDGTPFLLLYNDVSHVPPEKQSWANELPNFAAPPAKAAK